MVKKEELKEGEYLFCDKDILDGTTLAFKKGHTYKVLDNGYIEGCNKFYWFFKKEWEEFFFKNTEQKEDIMEETNEEAYINKFRELQDKCFETFKKKNHDYGNSFELSMNEEGYAAMRIRGGDKWNRFKTLSKGEDALVKDESIVDTLLDLSNYCIMTAMWAIKNKK